MNLYKHTTEHKWTQDELVATKLIKCVDFKVEDINVVSKRVAAAVAQGRFTNHNMRGK
jgi:hypothetical protein